MKLTLAPLRFSWLPCCLALMAAPALADTVHLDSGEVLIGRIVSENADFITIDSLSLGTVTVGAKGARVVRDESASAPEAVAADAESEPRGNWLRRKTPRSITASIQAGFDMANTDVEVRNYMLEAGLRWKGEEDEVQTRHYYEYLSIDGNRATDTYENSIRWIRHLSPRWILLSQADWLRDEGMGIDYRVDALAVAGYYFVKTDVITLLGGLGPAYEWEKWDRPGEAMTENLNVAAYELFRYQFNPRLRLEQTFLGYVSPKDDRDRRFHFAVDLRQMLTESMSIGLNYSFDYDKTPPPGFPDDQDRLTATIGYEF